MTFDAPFRSRLRLLLCILAAIVLAYITLRPSIHPVAVMKDDVLTPVTTWDETLIHEEDHNQDVYIQAQGALPIGAVDVYVDDCIDAVNVNGEELASDDLPYCDWFDYLQLPIGSLSHRGANTLKMTLHNDLGPGILIVVPSRASWLFRLAVAAAIAAIAAFGVWWLRREKDPADKVIVAGLAVGAALLVFYGVYNDFDTRAYDWDGHIEYMEYIADHWILPIGDQGWEFHQQPLYYIFGGAVLTVLRWAHAQEAFVSVMQAVSLLLSLGTLCASAWMAALLFPRGSKHAAVQRGIFLGLLATVPTWVMFSSRINNDVLTLFFASTCLAFLLSWWKSGSFETWVIACVALALALLSKSSALPLLAPVLLALLLRGDGRRRITENALLFALLIGVVLGGTFLVRVVLQGQHDLVPVWVTEGLRVHNFPAAYYTFNPWQIILHPFNNSWSDLERRQFLWEYFFRSAFFGEWDYQSMRAGAILLVSSAMMLLPVGAWGIIRSWMRPGKIEWIMTSLLVGSLLAIACFRFMHPNASNQELRYVSFVLVPMAYYLARGVAFLPKRFPALVLAGIVYAGSAISLVILAYTSR